MVNWTGLSRGIERGVGIGIRLDENKRRGIAAEEQSADRAQRRLLTDMQIEQYQDQTKRTEDLRNLRMAQEGLHQLKNNGSKFIESYNANPEAYEGMNAGMDRAGQIYADLVTEQQGDGLKRDYKRLIPTEGGKFAVEFTITKPDGTTYDAPATTNNSTDPDDQVQMMKLDDMGQFVSAIEADISSIDTQMIGLGDTSALDRRAANQSREQDIADKKGMFQYEQGIKNASAEKTAETEHLRKIAMSGINASNKLMTAKELAKIKINADGSAGAAGAKGQWTAKDFEKQLSTTVARALGMEGNYANWNQNKQAEYSRMMKAAYQVWKADPNLGLSEAFDMVNRPGQAVQSGLPTDSTAEPKAMEKAKAAAMEKMTDVQWLNTARAAAQRSPSRLMDIRGRLPEHLWPEFDQMTGNTTGTIQR